MVCCWAELARCRHPMKCEHPQLSGHNPSFDCKSHGQQQQQQHQGSSIHGESGIYNLIRNVTRTSSKTALSLELHAASSFGDMAFCMCAMHSCCLSVEVRIPIRCWQARFAHFTIAAGSLLRNLQIATCSCSMGHACQQVLLHIQRRR